MPFSVSTEQAETLPPPLLPMAASACRWTQRAAAFGALAMGGSNLFVWLAHWSPWPGFMVMRINTSVGVTSAALALFLWGSREPRWFGARAAQLLGACVALIGGLTAAQDIFGADLR